MKEKVNDMNTSLVRVIQHLSFVISSENVVQTKFNSNKMEANGVYSFTECSIGRL
jgi:hypothetical protein